MRNIGVTPVEKILEYDGLGFLKAIIDRTLPKPPIADLLGFDIVEAETGKAVFEGLPEFKHYNPIGVVHGGLALTLLDSACRARSRPRWRKASSTRRSRRR